MRRGLTLIEVLVALAILALAAVGLAATHGNLLLARESMRRLDREDEALRRAREAVLAADALAEGKTVGSGGERLAGAVALDDGSEATWEAELAAAGVGDLFTVRLTVRSGAAGEEREVAQTFDVMRPAWSAEADRRALLEAARERLGRARDFEGTLGGESGGGSGRPSRGRGGSGGGRGGPEAGRGGKDAPRGGPEGGRSPGEAGRPEAPRGEGEAARGPGARGAPEGGRR